MNIFIDWQSQKFCVDLSSPIDVSIRMKSGSENPNAFQIPHPRFEPIQVGDFVGSVEKGSGANCENLFINAHGNGTHTECIGHITRERVSINECLKQFHFIAQLLTLEPKTLDSGDQVLGLEGVEELLVDQVEALLVRTKPNGNEKLTQMYSGNNPVYLEPELTELVSRKGIRHLLVDLPSVDREEDAGKMLAHKAFWNYPENPRRNATITEMIFVPNDIPDGIYLLNIQIASLETDASPSKPVLYQLETIS